MKPHWRSSGRSRVSSRSPSCCAGCSRRCVHVLERGRVGAAVLHVRLWLVTREVHARTLRLPAPLRDPRVLCTLVLLDLESHPPSAGIDRVAIVVDPVPTRMLQFLTPRTRAAIARTDLYVARSAGRVDGRGALWRPSVGRLAQTGSVRDATVQSRDREPWVESQIPNPEPRTSGAFDLCSSPVPGSRDGARDGRQGTSLFAWQRDIAAWLAVGS